jgi:hypothetical protein
MSILLQEFQNINDNTFDENLLPLYVTPYSKSNSVIIFRKKIFILIFIGFLMLYVLFSSIIEAKHFRLRSQINDDDYIYRSREEMFFSSNQ